MSKAKWFVVRKPSAGEIIATSANQIVSSSYKNVVLSDINAPSPYPITSHFYVCVKFFTY